MTDAYRCLRRGYRSFRNRTHSMKLGMELNLHRAWIQVSVGYPSVEHELEHMIKRW